MGVPKKSVKTVHQQDTNQVLQDRLVVSLTYWFGRAVRSACQVKKTADRFEWEAAQKRVLGRLKVRKRGKEARKTLKSLVTITG